MAAPWAPQKDFWPQAGARGRYVRYDPPLSRDLSAAGEKLGQETASLRQAESQMQLLTRIRRFSR
jgi:hypothetical protein